MNARDAYFRTGPWVLVSREAFYWTGQTDMTVGYRRWWTHNVNEAAKFGSISDVYAAAWGQTRLRSARPRKVLHV